MNERQGNKLNTGLEIESEGIKIGKINIERVRPIAPNDLYKEIQEKIITPFYCFPNPRSIELNDKDVGLIEALLHVTQNMQQQNTLLQSELEEQIKYGRKITLIGDGVKNVTDMLKKDYISKEDIKKILDKYRHVIASEESAVDMYQDILAATK